MKREIAEFLVFITTVLGISLVVYAYIVYGLSKNGETIIHVTHIPLLH